MAVLDVFSARQGVIWCHFGALRGGPFVHVCSSKVATEGSGEGKCGRVVSTDVLETRKHTYFQWILTFFEIRRRPPPMLEIRIYTYFQ